jgi:DNA-binding NarL/FixJ family response regulator
MLCQDCLKRNSCPKLCQDVEIHVNQDYVGLRELPIGLPMYGEFPESISNISMTKMEKKIVSLVGQGLSRKEVCELLKISRLALRAHLIRLRKKCNEND